MTSAVVSIALTLSMKASPSGDVQTTQTFRSSSSTGVNIGRAILALAKRLIRACTEGFRSELDHGRQPTRSVSRHE